MKRNIILAALAAFISSVPESVEASTTHILRDVPFTVDTIQHYPIAPGTLFTQMRYQSQQSQTKHFTVSVIDFEMAKASDGGVDWRMHLGCDSVHTSERMTAVARHHTDDSNQYLAAINGDFFITWASTPGMLGYPNNTACCGGQMALSDNVDHDNHVDAWIMDKQGGMWCDQTVLSPKIIMPDNTTNYKLYGVNFARRDDARLDAQSDAKDIVFYNEHRGRFTGSPSGWREIAVKRAEGAQWRINASVKMEVIGEVSTGGHMAIPRDGGVIAAAPDAPIDLESLHPGDIVKLKINLSLPSFGDLKPDVKEVCGGDVTLLRDGEAVMTANRFINSRDGEYPRTMVGYNADRSHMIWCVVDGKTALNTGCSYPQGADMMKAYGCVDAINFDGGGSTMMWTLPAGIVNTPSDGQERAVGSGLFAVLQAPKDNEVASIRFKDWALTAPQYAVYTPIIYGYNRYGQLVDTDIKDYALSCETALGEVSADGLSVLTSGRGCHALTATLGDMTATLPVDVVEATDVAFECAEMIADNLHQWPIVTLSRVGQEMMPLAPQALTWSSDAPDVAVVDANGVVTGIADGVATITGEVGSFKGEVKVSVECPKLREMPLESPVNADNWKLSGSGVGSLGLTVVGADAMKISYSITSTRSPRVTIAPVNPMKLWGIPDALCLTANPAGAEVSGVTLTLTPANARNVTLKADALAAGADNALTFNFSDAVEPGDPAVYPLTLQSIAFNLSGSGEGSIDLTSMATLYNGFTGVENLPVADGYDPYAPVEYYNLQGIRVEGALAPGIYIRRQGARATKLLLK